ncbi:MAG: S4 domain-containing protein [Candidatus Moduliflexus flocculans]|nr:S4 domain-containing protein [Candidatus Moduliflexus flocculans]
MSVSGRQQNDPPSTPLPWEACPKRSGTVFLFGMLAVGLDVGEVVENVDAGLEIRQNRAKPASVRRKRARSGTIVCQIPARQKRRCSSSHWRGRMVLSRALSMGILPFYLGKYNANCMPKIRLDVLLMERGLAESRAKAQALIMAGQVRVNDQVALKPATAVDSRSVLTVDRGPRFVSRGGEKLDAALEAFAIDVSGLRLRGRGRVHGRVHRLPAPARRGEGLCH